MATTAYDFDATALDGSPQPLSDWRGKVLLVVNVASKCGFTPQYAGLEKLWRDFGDKGLVVLGFPCDQSFPMFARIEVNGANAHPLWKWLKDEKGGLLGFDAIKWNFTKFLVGRDGRVLKRYAPTDKPESIARDIEQALAG